MRSRKVEPGSAVMRTMIQSEITWVPPVTAERSPPLSRMTGADSPVIAASLTEATPSITSPSRGMRSPASTSTTSPGLELGRRHRLEHVAVRRRRSRLAIGLGLAPCARSPPAPCRGLRPPPRRSWRTARVNQSQTTDLEREAELAARRSTRSRTNRTVVSVATTSTANITGFLISARGSSLRKASTERPARGSPGRSAWTPTSGGRSESCHHDCPRLRRGCRPASRGARRSGRARGPGRR